MVEGLACDLGVQHLPNMYQGLATPQSKAKQNKKETLEMQFFYVRLQKSEHSVALGFPNSSKFYWAFEMMHKAQFT